MPIPRLKGVFAYASPLSLSSPLNLNVFMISGATVRKVDPGPSSVGQRIETLGKRLARLITVDVLHGVPYISKCAG